MLLVLTTVLVKLFSFHVLAPQLSHVELKIPPNEGIPKPTMVLHIKCAANPGKRFHESEFVVVASQRLEESDSVQNAPQKRVLPKGLSEDGMEMEFTMEVLSGQEYNLFLIENVHGLELNEQLRTSLVMAFNFM